MELFAIQQIAERTGTSVSFWRAIIRKGELPVIRLGRLIRLDGDDVREFLSRNTQRRPSLERGELAK